MAVPPRSTPDACRTLARVALLLLLSGTSLAAQDTAAKAAAAKPVGGVDSTLKLSNDQLDALVAPIALYPDELLAQTLVASTYPLEIVQLQQWLAKHPGLKDKALADSVMKQSWDPSIQSMAALPDLVKRLAEDIQWTTELGNAFLADQKGISDAVQRMRSKAKEKGTLTSGEQQKVETKTVDQQQVIVIQSTNPEVVYVPSYSPTVVYGPPVYPYPPIYYPPYPPGGMFLSFTVGMMWGAAIWGGSCCHMGWHGGNVNINVNNNFNRVNHNNIGGGGRGNGNWSHNPEHRGGTPYGDRRTSDKYGSGNRAGTSDRAAAGNRGGAGVSDRATAGNRGGAGVSDRATAGAGNRGGAGVSDRATAGAGAGNRGGAGVSDRSAGGMGGSSIGNQNLGGGGGRSSGLSGGGGSYNGGQARANSNRGASSYGSMRGSSGGGMRSGGGGMRGGGGGGRRR